MAQAGDKVVNLLTMYRSLFFLSTEEKGKGKKVVKPLTVLQV